MTLWHNPEIDLPNDDRDVLCVISGSIKNVVYDKAIVIGAYCDGYEAGWCFDTVVEADMEDYDKFTVHCWTELPKVPKSILGDENE